MLTHTNSSVVIAHAHSRDPLTFTLFTSDDWKLWQSRPPLFLPGRTQRESEERAKWTDWQTDKQSEIEPKREREREKGRLLLSPLLARRSSRLPLFQWAPSPGPFKPEPVPASSAPPSSHSYFSPASYDALRHVTVNGPDVVLRLRYTTDTKATNTNSHLHTQVAQLSLKVETVTLRLGTQ